MISNRRRFLQAAGVLATGAMMPDAFAKRAAPELGTTTGINPFAFDLHARLRAEKGNVFASPFSISTALAMTAGGAKGNTLSQMCKTMKFTGTPEEPVGHSKFGQMMQLFGGNPAANANRPFELHIANGIWAQKTYAWKKEFEELVQQRYLANIRSVDFQGASEEQRRAINTWVEEVTQKKIKELFAKGVINPLTRMALVNAIYYKAAWATPFQKRATKDAPFLLADGTKKTSRRCNSNCVPISPRTKTYNSSSCRTRANTPRW